MQCLLSVWRSNEPDFKQGALDGSGNEGSLKNEAGAYFGETKGLSVNKTFALASGFWAAFAAPQSQNPRRSAATPAVLLNPRDQISFKIRRDP